jgi:hypothetical protein
MSTMPIGIVEATRGLVKRARRLLEVYRILLEWNNKPPRAFVFFKIIHTPGVAVSLNVQITHSK